MGRVFSTKCLLGHLLFFNGGQPGQSGCGSGNDRERRSVGIHHSSRDVRTIPLNHLQNVIPLYQPEPAK